MRKYIFLTAISCLFIMLIVYPFNNNIVHANDLAGSISEQLENIDLTELENYYNRLTDKQDINISLMINNMLNGIFDNNFNSAYEYIAKVLLKNVINITPLFLSIIAISILCGLINNFKSTFLSSGVSNLIFFTCFLSIILILSEGLIEIFKNSNNVIENLMNLTEIMSPIILTLMTASGGTVSASVYKPAVAFISGGVINLVLNVIIPLIIIMTFFTIISCMSQTVKLSKFIDTITSIIKWIVGLTIAIFGIYISLQGITSATFDGISIKAAKYAISNSIPIIGGFIKDGFDLVVAGSILIKNAVGITCVVALFYTIISPLIYIIVFSLLLKISSALIDSISDTRISNLCMGLSKCLSYVTMSMIMVGFMFFIIVILMIISANAFF